MIIKLKFKSPTTPSKRQLIQLNTDHLKKKPFIKKSLKGFPNSSGRNNSGKITVRHKGGGNKKKYRNIDFKRMENSIGIICSIEYDPNRNSHVASVFDFSINSAINFYYIIASQNANVGDIIKSGIRANVRLGHSLPMFKIPVGSYLYNISTKVNENAKVTRSAGTFSLLKELRTGYATIELSSNKRIDIPENCFGTLGIVSNEFNFLTQLGKAGNSRWLNRRPSVRGVAMNPVDHPHGGGEGKTSGKNKTPWGKFNK